MSGQRFEYVTVTGLGTCVKRLRALPRALSGAKGGPIRGALFAATKTIRDEARRLAPVGTGTPLPGNLRRQIFAYRDRNPRASGAAERYIISIRTGRRRTNKVLRQFGAPSVQSAIRAIGGDAFYWRFVEFGTVKQPAQSFMRNAFETQKRTAIAVFTHEFSRGLDRAVQVLTRQIR
jgi:HK97 gp10 family phage protein